MPYALVVVDMQHGFPASKNSATRNAAAEYIQEAVDDGAFIIFLEFDGYGKTWSKLVRICKGYEKFRVLTKIENDGSYHVHSFLKYMRKKHIPIRLLGVNTNFCVQDTAKGLASKGYKDITLLFRGCNQMCSIPILNSNEGEILKMFKIEVPIIKIDKGKEACLQNN